MTFQAFESIPTVFGLVATVATTFFVYNRWHGSRNAVPLPPGPPARRFWENVMPAANIARKFAEWVTEYGPVIALRQGSHVTIVIGRLDAAVEIMEKQGNALVDRPRSISAGEMLSKGLRMLLLRRGERLRRYRRAANTHLQPKAVGAYLEIQLENAKNLVMDILRDPGSHVAHAELFSTSLVLRLTYGKSTPTAYDDPEVVRIRQVSQNLFRVMRPGAYLVDRIPWLRYIPGYGRELKKSHEREIQLYREQMERVRSEMETNYGGDSFMKLLLEHANEYGFSRDETAYLAGSLFLAGSGTTAAVISYMIMAAACHPEAQQRVQEELDAVVGKDRVPTWDDSELLPQVHAFILEVHRWRPILPNGVPHRATRDIIWSGQRIPAGATVFGSHWAISRDPVAFPDPEKFDPQRWIDEEGRIKEGMTSYPFGFGRRVCPGRHLASKSLYITLAFLLWAFRIAERPESPIDTTIMTDTLVTEIAPFDVQFIPRMEVGLLKEMMSDLGPV